ncbi:hypothetical protein R3I94_018483 [Phoxinus phoxinus]
MSTLPALEETDWVPSTESEDTVGRHTDLLHLTDELGLGLGLGLGLDQSVSGAPAPGASATTAVIRSKIDEKRRKMKRKHFKARRRPKNLKSILRLRELWKDEGPLIYRDENDNIKIIDLSDREKYVQIIVKKCMSHLIDLLPICSFFSVNQEMSAKVSGFIKNLNIDNKIFLNQCGFAVIEFKDGLPELVGPFKPVKVLKANVIHMVHSEVQCIREIKNLIKGKEEFVKTIFIITKYSPCLDGKDCECCMSQLIKFTEEMYSNIEVVIAFQDFYGVSGNIVEELLKVLLNNGDTLIKNTLQRLKEKMIEHHRRSTFTCFQGNKKRKKTSRKDWALTIKEHIKTEMRKSNLLNWKEISFIIGFEIKFPSKKKTFYEFRNFGEEQADELKRYVKKLKLSEEITKKVCSLFQSKWCQLVYEEYEEIIFEKLSDYINAIAVRVAYNNIKAITHPGCFNLIRVKLTG